MLWIVDRLIVDAPKVCRQKFEEPAGAEKLTTTEGKCILQA